MQTLLKSTVVVVLLSALLSTAAAGIYVWTDENGRKHFSDKKPVSNVDVKEIKQKRLRPSTGAARRATDSDSAATSRQKPVDNSVKCRKKRTRCETQWRDEYDYIVSLCRGNWSAAAAIGNAAYGGNRTGRSMAQDCKREARDKRDTKLKSCSNSYNMCMKN